MIRAFLDEHDITLPMLGGFTVAVIAAAFIIIQSFSLDDRLLPLYAMASAALGWLVGILSAPLNKGEEGRFGQFGKILAGIITGYVLSKIDPMVLASLTADEQGNYPIFRAFDQTRLLVCLTSFLVALITIYNARSYWSAQTDNSSAEGEAGSLEDGEAALPKRRKTEPKKGAKAP